MGSSRRSASSAAEKAGDLVETAICTAIYIAHRDQHFVDSAIAECTRLLHPHIQTTARNWTTQETEVLTALVQHFGLGYGWTLVQAAATLIRLPCDAKGTARRPDRLSTQLHLQEHWSCICLDLWDASVMLGFNIHKILSQPLITALIGTIIAIVEDELFAHRLRPPKAPSAPCLPIFLPVALERYLNLAEVEAQSISREAHADGCALTPEKPHSIAHVIRAVKSTLMSLPP